MTRNRSVSDSGLRVKVLVLDNRGFIMVNEGFSVVAPISVITPSSIPDRSESCWDLENLCISSMKSIVL